VEVKTDGAINIWEETVHTFGGQVAVVLGDMATPGPAGSVIRDPLRPEASGSIRRCIYADMSKGACDPA
jgi:hypothetical protein